MRCSPRLAALAAAALLGTGALVGCAKDNGSIAAFCDQVEKVPSLESVLSRFSEADRDVLQDRIDKARAAYDELAATAPKVIAEEADQVVELVDAILDAVEQHPTDPEKASAQLRTAMDEHAEVDADRAKLAAYAQEECDVQLDAALTDGPGAATTTTTTVPGGAGTPSSTSTPGG